MRTRIIETLIFLAAGLFAVWRIVMASGQADIISFKTLFIAGLIILTGSNLFLRSKKIATAIFAACALLTVLFALVFLMSQTHRDKYPVSWFVSPFVLYGLVGVTGWFQMHSALTQSGRATAPKVSVTEWLGIAGLGLIALVFLTHCLWPLLFFWPVLLFSSSLFRTLGWSNSSVREHLNERYLRRKLDAMERRAMKPPPSP